MRTAKIGRDDLRMARHLGRLAVGDKTPLVQHRDPVGHREHTIDVMLDQQHRARPGQPLDQFADNLPIGFGEAGQRLVEQQ